MLGYEHLIKSVMMITTICIRYTRYNLIFIHLFIFHTPNISSPSRARICLTNDLSKNFFSFFLFPFFLLLFSFIHVHTDIIHLYGWILSRRNVKALLEDSQRKFIIFLCPILLNESICKLFPHRSVEIIEYLS